MFRTHNALLTLLGAKYRETQSLTRRVTLLLRKLTGCGRRCAQLEYLCLAFARC